MGGKQSVEEQKAVDTTGHVNNNVVVGAMETHSTILTIIAVELGIVCLIGFVQLLIYTHCNHLKNLKKRYAKQGNQQQPNNT